MKAFVSLLLSALLLLTSLSLSVSALTADEDITANWDVMGIKYATRTTLPLTVYDENGKKIPKTEGFEFNLNSDGGIDMGVPSYEVLSGAFGASLITSKHTAPLGGLCVDIDLTNFDFQLDKHDMSNNIGILWTEEKITDLNNLKDCYSTRYYGLRYLIPTKMDNEDFHFGVPASGAQTDEISGKALYINLSNVSVANKGTKTATTLTIVYYDGHFINEADGYPGYRWVFTVADEIMPLNDELRIDHSIAPIDLSEGLKVTVKADDDLGYIVNINGKDY